MSHITELASPRAADTTAALDALRRIVRELRLANGGVEKGTGLSAAQLYVLAQVAHTPGASLTQLAEQTLTDRTSVAAVVDRLLQRGLVERARSSSDRRRVEIVPTAAGAAILERAPHAPTRRILDALAALDDGALRQVAEGLTRLTQGMGLAHEPSETRLAEQSAA